MLSFVHMQFTSEPKNTGSASESGDFLSVNKKIKSIGYHDRVTFIRKYIL